VLETVPDVCLTVVLGCYMAFCSRGLSGYRARRQVADSREPELWQVVSDLGDRGPTPQPQGVMCGLP